MQKLKTLLDQNHSNKKKSEVVDILVGLEKLLGPEEYAAISGVESDTDVSSLNKSDLVDILKKFSEGYSPTWEEKMAGSGINFLQASTASASKASSKFLEQDLNILGADGSAPDDGFAAELGSIDFEKLIGGPMQAAVKAQTGASMATVNFIQEVGFTGEGEDKALQMADFSYSRQVPDPENEGQTKTEKVDVKVPFISILSLPCLRVETLDIDFNVKLNSTFSREVNQTAGVEVGASAGWGPVKMKVSSSYQRSSATGTSVQKEYSMNVKVRATNDEMPAGLEKVLGMLSD